MTVLESETTSRHALLLPFERNGANTRFSGTHALFCPNIAELESPYFQKAEQHLGEMHNALKTENVEVFNESRRLLLQLLRKHGAPIAQWNQLVLEFSDPTFLKNANLPNIDLNMTRLRAVLGHLSLEKACLQGAGFLCADLREVVLTEADLTGADLRFADLAESDLTGAMLLEAKLGGARLTSARLNKANLYCANLNGANLRHAVLTEANLRKADLRNADCCKASFCHARMQQADLRETNFLMADLSGARLRNADLRKTYFGFSCLRETRFQHARLQETDFSSADLTLADFQRCRMMGVMFGRATMSGATMQHADCQEVDFQECCQLETVNFEGACFDEATHFPPDFVLAQRATRNSSCSPLKRLVRMFTGLQAEESPVPAR